MSRTAKAPRRRPDPAWHHALRSLAAVLLPPTPALVGAALTGSAMHSAAVEPFGVAGVRHDTVGPLQGTEGDAEDTALPAGEDDLPSQWADQDGADPELWALVEAAQRGDGDAFGAIYDRYVDTVYRYIAYRVADRGLAEDLTSETFLRALRRFGSVTYQGRDLAAFFVTIARNLVFDHTKSARYRLEVVTDDRVEPDDGHDDTETQVLAALTNERLLWAVRELPDEQHECIVLRFLQGLSVAETAAVMGKNEGAVKAMQHRAVKRLHTLLAGELS